MTDLAQPLNSAQNAAVTARVTAEISAAPLSAKFGMDQVDWGEGKGGKLYECWKVEPCCGQPVNPKDAVYCCLHFWCCALCTISNLQSKVLGQETWSIVPTCCFLYFCNICSRTAARYNLRRRQNVPGNMMGDCILTWCCGPCAACQELRSVPKSMWDLMPFKAPAVVGPVQFIQ